MREEVFAPVVDPNGQPTFTTIEMMGGLTRDRQIDILKHAYIAIEEQLDNVQEFLDDAHRFPEQADPQDVKDAQDQAVYILRNLGMIRYWLKVHLGYEEDPRDWS